MDTTQSAHTRLGGLEQARPAPTTPVSTVIAWGARNATNLGAIIRLAANFGCGQVFFVDSPDAKHNLRQIRKTAVDGPKYVEWCFVSPAELTARLGGDLPIVALETSAESVDLRDVCWPSPCALMVGGERLGLPDEALALCAVTAHIATCGPVRSLNVSQAAAIGLFASTAAQSSTAGSRRKPETRA